MLRKRCSGSGRSYEGEGGRAEGGSEETKGSGGNAPIDARELSNDATDSADTGGGGCAVGDGRDDGSGLIGGGYDLGGTCAGHDVADGFGADR